MKMDGDDFARWCEGAQPGESITYCRGARLSADAAVVPVEMARVGVVELVQRRLSSGDLAYIAQRRSDAFVRPGDAGRVRRRVSSPGTSPARRAVERQLYRMLVRTANHHLPCPDNGAIARLLGLRDALAASYRMRRLVAAGLIVVEQGAPGARRVVTIVASGARTRPCALKPGRCEG